ncbi:MAG TPA: hypothetical protein VFY83_04225 [Anaerolineales bacterium]|jgi:hypothetical protein|nr:hypothetical protein [Anaerolineales bacterium]
MEDKQGKPVMISRPRDTSLAAYKAWILELCQRLTTKEICIIFTDEEWIDNWKAYWEEQAPLPDLRNRI